MSEAGMATLVFGAFILGALILFVIERRAVARRKAARGGREVDVTNLIAFGSAAAQGDKTHK
jgi:hypothetical protein